MGSLRVGLFSEVSRPLRNGVVAAVDALGEALCERGHQVIRVTPVMSASFADQTIARENETAVRLPSLPLPTRTGYRLTLPFWTREHAARLGAPSVVHAHSLFVTGRMALRVARRLGVPLVFTYHTQLEHYAHYVPVVGSLTRGMMRALTRRYANAADLVVVPTRATERYLRAIGVLARIEIVPSGIDVARFVAGKRDARLRMRWGVPENAEMVLWVGRLGAEKNPRLALEAFGRLGSDAHLVIVGTGVQREELERIARCATPGRVHFLGEQDRSTLPDLYACADVFLFTSISETQGLVLVEALAAGLPIVAVDTPQTREVTEGVGCFQEPDPEALACGMRAVLAQADAPCERSMAVARRYDAGVLADRMIDLYRSVLSSS